MCPADATPLTRQGTRLCLCPLSGPRLHGCGLCSAMLCRARAPWRSALYCGTHGAASARRPACEKGERRVVLAPTLRCVGGGGYLRSRAGLTVCSGKPQPWAHMPEGGASKDPPLHWVTSACSAPCRVDPGTPKVLTIDRYLSSRPAPMPPGSVLGLLLAAICIEMKLVGARDFLEGHWQRVVLHIANGHADLSTILQMELELLQADRRAPPGHIQSEANHRNGRNVSPRNRSAVGLTWERPRGAHRSALRR